MDKYKGKGDTNDAANWECVKGELQKQIQKQQKQSTLTGGLFCFRDESRYQEYVATIWGVPGLSFTILISNTI